jgi:hypothetical protein
MDLCPVLVSARAGQILVDARRVGVKPEVPGATSGQVSSQEM